MEYGDRGRTVEPYRHVASTGSSYLYHDAHVATVPPIEARRGIDPWQVTAR